MRVTGVLRPGARQPVGRHACWRSRTDHPAEKSRTNHVGESGLGESGIALLERVFNRGPIPARGSGFTVNAASFNYRQPYALSSLASYRQVVNLADWRDSWTMHTTGQSGQLFSPHYSDMIGPWQRVEYHRMLYTEADLRAANADELTLIP